MIEHVIEKSGLRQHYRTEKEGQDRLENLDELINAAATFVDDEGAVGEGGALASFLAHASLEAGEHQAGEGDEAVQLMTVHSAKGLEFDVVFITGLEQGLFPHENAVLQGQEGLEEERRLMYVAVTRARQRLYLSCAQTRMLHGQTRYCLPSSFLDEIPENLLLKLNRRAARGARAGIAAAASTPPNRRRRSAHRADGGACQVRHRRHRRDRGARGRRPRAGQFRRQRHEVAGARVRQADAGLGRCSTFLWIAIAA